MHYIEKRPHADYLVALYPPFFRVDMRKRLAIHMANNFYLYSCTTRKMIIPMPIPIKVRNCVHYHIKYIPQLPSASSIFFAHVIVSRIAIHKKKYIWQLTGNNNLNHNGALESAMMTTGNVLYKKRIYFIICSVNNDLKLLSVIIELSKSCEFSCN